MSHELCPVGLSCFCMCSPRPACHVIFDSLTADLSVVLPFFLDLTYTRQKNVPDRCERKGGRDRRQEVVGRGRRGCQPGQQVWLDAIVECQL